jgi:ribosomal protein L7/L12
MTALLAVLEFNDYAFIAGIMVIFAGSAAFKARPEINLARLERQMREMQGKLDALMRHQGIAIPPPPPSGLSPEVERLASSPETKIAAIKLYREEKPGIGLREAKEAIEEFYKSRH